MIPLWLYLLIVGIVFAVLFLVLWKRDEQWHKEVEGKL